MPEPPEFSFGVLADPQYADQDTVGRRQYRRALARMEESGEALRRENPAFVVQLGDLVDCGRDNLDRILEVLRTFPQPRYGLLGNHDFCAPRTELLERLGLPSAYYTFARPGWRFIFLDGTGASVCGWRADEPNYCEGRAILDELISRGAPNAHEWNGGLGREQREWLRRVLAEAARDRERAIVFCHLPVAAGSSRPEHLLWDHQEVLAILDEAPSLVLWISGHDHRGGYTLRNGVHYLTLPGMLEHDAAESCKIVDVHRSVVVIRAPGEVAGRTLPLR